jgi:hypothetical protein
MNYKEPTQEQIKLMQEYSDICGAAIELIMKCEQNVMLQHASARMQESMSWFHTYVINGGKLSNESVN